MKKKTLRCSVAFVAGARPNSAASSGSLRQPWSADLKYTAICISVVVLGLGAFRLRRQNSVHDAAPTKCAELFLSIRPD